jgi:hypothetical protein
VKDRISEKELERIRIRLAEWVWRHSKQTDSVTFAEQTRAKLDAFATGPKAYAPSGPGGKGGHSDPTCNAATRDDHITDAWQRQYATAWFAIDKAIKSIDRLTETAHGRADRRDRTTNDSLIPVCANPYCRDDITEIPSGTVPWRGRCKRCGDFLREHDRDAGPKVINSRRRYETQRLAPSSDNVQVT